MALMGVSDLQKLVDASSLPEQDKDLWLHALEVMDDEQAQAVLDAVADDPHELEALTRNVKLKQVALASGDHALLDQILEDETEDIYRI